MNPGAEFNQQRGKGNPQVTLIERNIMDKVLYICCRELAALTLVQ